MAAAKQQYYTAIRNTLNASLCLQNFPSMKVECHNKPEIEIPSGKETVLTPMTIARSELEAVKIEPAINSCRVSVRVTKMDGLTAVLVDRFARFLMLRAEAFKILRRKAIDGYDISFLITNFHTETLLREKLVEFVVTFIQEIDSQVSTLKLDVNKRAREVAATILKPFSR